MAHISEHLKHMELMHAIDPRPTNVQRHCAMAVKYLVISGFVAPDLTENDLLHLQRKLEGWADDMIRKDRQDYHKIPSPK